MTEDDWDVDEEVAYIRSLQPGGGRSEAPAATLPSAGEVWDMTTDEVRKLFFGVDRSDGPAYLSELVAEGVLEDETIAALVGYVWAMVEYPEVAADRAEWVEWFRTAGEGRIIHDERGSIPAPTEVPVLYRGGKLRDRMSWTSSREVAERFANGLSYRPTDGTVWAIRDLPPELVLARIEDRKEQEWVIDIAAYEGEPEVVQ